MKIQVKDLPPMISPSVILRGKLVFCTCYGTKVIQWITCQAIGNQRKVRDKVIVSKKKSIRNEFEKYYRTVTMSTEDPTGGIS